MSTRKNRHGVVTEKKRNKKHVPMVKKTKGLSWDDLTKIAQESAKLLGYTYAHYEYFRTNRAKIIEDNLEAKESMTGLAKMLADHAEQLKKLALTHTELDDEGNPIIVDGKAKLKRGKFKTDDEVIAQANDSEYGLGGAVFTKNINRALRLAREIQTGRVWVNTYNQIPEHAPFGGYKKSGIGRETHKVILEHYTQMKNILIDLEEETSGLY